MVLYHGTDDPNVVGIGGGYLGAGVYFTPDKDAAELIAAHQGMGFVMTCSVDVGAVYDFDAGSPGLAVPGVSIAIIESYSCRSKNRSK